MFLQHQNSFIQKDKITYFSIDEASLQVVIYFGKDDYYIATFNERRDLDFFVAQLRKQ